MSAPRPVRVRVGDDLGALLDRGALLVLATVLAAATGWLCASFLVETTWTSTARVWVGEAAAGVDPTTPADGVLVARLTSPTSLRAVARDAATSVGAVRRDVHLSGDALVIVRARARTPEAAHALAAGVVRRATRERLDLPSVGGLPVRPVVVDAPSAAASSRGTAASLDAAVRAGLLGLVVAGAGVVASAVAHDRVRTRGDVVRTVGARRLAGASP